jgi:hypothetical protein
MAPVEKDHERQLVSPFTFRWKAPCRSIERTRDKQPAQQRWRLGAHHIQRS